MRKPVVQIMGSSGSNLVPGWGKVLLAVRFTDNEGGEADELEMDFSVSTPLPPPPAKGTQYRLYYGWDEVRLRDAGSFTSQSPSLSYSADNGWVLTVVSRSADFVDADKAADSEHFDDMTASAIFERLAQTVGKTAKVHPSLDSIKIPYRLRLQQSAAGFGQDLADELGASLKLANGGWLVTLKNSGETASGTPMPAINIDINQISETDLTTDAGPEFGQVETTWFDGDKGLSRIEATAGGGKTARIIGLHQAASQTEAALVSVARSVNLARASVTGSVTLEGDIDAMAGAAVILSGLDAWGGYGLVAPSIQHTFTFDESGGWMMTVQCAAKTKGTST